MSWKDNATVIKRNIFLHADDTNSLHYPKILTMGLKSRPTDERGVYKSNIMYEVSSDVFKPLAEAWAKKNKSDVLRDNIAEILGIDDRLVVYYNDKDGHSYNYILYHLNPYKWGADEHWWEKDFTLRFALFSDMKKVELSAKEKAIKEKQDLTKRKVTFNNLVFRDNIVAAFKKHGYLLEAWDNKEYRLRYQSGSHSYNDFIEAAIDHYINNVLLKDLGCKVHVPKPSSRKGVREAYDNLIDMENVEIEGEQNAEIK